MLIFLYILINSHIRAAQWCPFSLRHITSKLTIHMTHQVKGTLFTTLPYSIYNKNSAPSMTLYLTNISTS